MRRSGPRSVASWPVLLAALGAAGAPATEVSDLLRLRVERAAEPPAPLGDAVGPARALVPLLATYCPPCRAEVPALNRAARRGLRVVGLFVDVGDAPTLARVVAEWGIDFDTRRVAAGEEAVVARLAPQGLPVSFVVRGGTVERLDRVLEGAQVDAILAGDGGVP